MRISAPAYWVIEKKNLCAVFLASWQKYQTAKSDKYRKTGNLGLSTQHKMKSIKQVTLTTWANPGTIEAAHILTSRGKRKKRAVRMYDENREAFSRQLSIDIIEGTYVAAPYAPATIIDGGKERELLKSPYRDHVVRRAFMSKLELYILSSLVPFTYAALPERGSTRALQHVRSALLHDLQNTRYCLKLDVRKYFASVNREVLKDKFSKKFRDKDTVSFASTLIDEPPGTGLPIGNYTSQWFANMYLSDFDHWVLRELNVKHYYRYMDDIVILADSKERLHQVLRRIERYMAEELHLAIKDNYQIFPVEARGIDYVGYRIWRNRVILRKTTFNRLRKTARRLNRTAKQRQLTQEELSSLFAYLGRAKFCTKKARQTIYQNYFKETIDLAEPYLKKKTVRKIRKLYT